MEVLGPGRRTEAEATPTPQLWSFCTMSTPASGWSLRLTRPRDAKPPSNEPPTSPDSPAGMRTDAGAHGPMQPAWALGLRGKPGAQRPARSAQRVRVLVLALT